MGRDKGFYAESKIKELIDEGRIFPNDSRKSISYDNIQPASFEPRIGSEIYVTDVIDRQVEGAGKKETINDGYVLKKGHVYRARLLERLNLPADVGALVNPKSRMGRAGLNVRLIADDAPDAYDKIPFGYKGPISIELTSRAFDYVIAPGMVFNQIRFMNAPLEKIQFSDTDILKYIVAYRQRETPGEATLSNGGGISLVSFLFDNQGNEAPLDKLKFNGDTLLLHNSNNFSNTEGIVAYRSKLNWSKPLDLRNRSNNWKDFFEPVHRDSIENDLFIARPGEFFLNSSAEILHCPDDLIMATTPFDPKYGDMKGDHAGFIDPGFVGTLTFEPVVYESAPFALRTWIPMMGLKVAPLIGEVERKYGKDRGNAHFAQVGVKLGPFFKEELKE